MSSAQYPTATLSDVETKRLFLRRFEPADLSALAEVFAKPEVWRFPYGRGFSREETSTFLDGQLNALTGEPTALGVGLPLRRRQTEPSDTWDFRFLPFCLRSCLPLRLDGGLIRSCGGEGYATEGASAAIDHGFDELGLTAICSVPQSGNPASTRVCERLGMSWGARGPDPCVGKAWTPCRGTLLAQETRMASC